jgi:hypothetical protein
LAVTIIKALDYKWSFSTFALGQSTVLVSVTGVLAIDSYILKIACILSLNTYVLTERLNEIDLYYMITAEVVISIISWML